MQSDIESNGAESSRAEPCLLASSYGVFVSPAAWCCPGLWKMTWDGTRLLPAASLTLDRESLLATRRSRVQKW